MIYRIILSVLLAAGSSASAYAHGGHLSDLAGHSHWVGIAALAGAALVTGVAAWASRKGKDPNETEDVDGKKPANEANQ